MIKSNAGFTVIELMIAIVLMAVLLVLGLPSFSAYTHNAKLRATAHTFLAGLQNARGEAIRRNALVDFVLTNNDVTSATFSAVTPATNGQSWLIRTNSLDTLIEAKSALEGSGRAAGEASPVQVAGSVSTVTFNGLGGTTLGAAATFQFTNPTGGACASAGGPMRCLNVVVSAGGQARLCDPAVGAAATAAGDTRGC